MISVEQALESILAAFSPLPGEQVALAQALGRVLAEPVVARRTQPPADMSAMDGYAVRSADTARVPATLEVVGEAPAGGSFAGTVGAGQAVRIFTGAPVPDGADAIVIQEDTEADGRRVTVKERAEAGRHVRRAGLDFRAGDIGVAAGEVLGARDLALAAAMNRPWLTVRRKPRVAVLATGDEVVMPGEDIGPNQIVSSNSLALAAVIEASGGEAVMLGIAPDDAEALAALAAGARGHDLLVTTGGVSVGDRDLVRRVLGERGLEVEFWRIAMRPGKPLLFGSLAGTPVLGLPGNPVSALVCALVFLRPALAVMLGIDGAGAVAETTARLASPLAANDRRQDYLRARFARAADGVLEVTPFPVQDSSMLSVLAQADGLVVRPPNAPPAAAGATVPVIPFPPGFAHF